MPVLSPLCNSNAMIQISNLPKAFTASTDTRSYYRDMEQATLTKMRHFTYSIILGCLNTTPSAESTVLVRLNSVLTILNVDIDLTTLLPDLFTLPFLTLRDQEV